MKSKIGIKEPLEQVEENIVLQQPKKVSTYWQINQLVGMYCFRLRIADLQGNVIYSYLLKKIRKIKSMISKW